MKVVSFRTTRVHPLVGCLIGLIVLGLATASSAVTITTFTNKALFTVAAGGSLITEDFNSFLVETGFHTTPLDVGDFTLSMTGSPSTSPRNSIDVPPPQFAVFDVDGTVIANVLTTASVDLIITFDTPQTAFGADLAAFNDSILRTTIDILGVSSVAPVTAGDVVRFFGMVSDTPFTVVTFVGVINDGFGMDNVVYNNVPEPSTFALVSLGLAATALRARRRLH